MDKGTINFSNGASSKTCHREDQNPSQYACGDEEEDARAARATAVADEYEQLVADLSRRWPRALREDSRTGRQQHAAWDDDEDFDDDDVFEDDDEDGEEDEDEDEDEESNPWCYHPQAAHGFHQPSTASLEPSTRFLDNLPRHGPSSRSSFSSSDSPCHFSKSARKR